MSQRHPGCGGVCNSAVDLEDRGRKRESRDNGKSASNFLRRSSQVPLDRPKSVLARPSSSRLDS